MLIIAHRGANREALENSWQAFRKALDIGCERLELDLQLTSDQHVVVMHDDSLFRTTGRVGNLSAMKRQEITKLSLLNGEKIPFLAELLAELLPHIELNLELKGDRPQLAAEAARLVEATPFADKVIFSCFHPRPLQYLRKHHPTLKVAVLWGRVDTFAINPTYALAPQLMMADCQSTILHPEVRSVDARFMDQAHARGWTVYPWVPMAGEENHSRQKLWAHLQELEVPGLCTNYPRELKQWLEQQKAPK